MTVESLIERTQRDLIEDIRQWLIRSALIGALSPADRALIEAFITDYALDRGLS